MVRRFRWLSVITAGTLLVAALLAPAVVLAGTQGSDCPTDPTRLLLWENSIGDTADNNDNLWKCGNVANLSNTLHTLSGDCRGPFWWSGNWNDCIDSFTYWGVAGVTACFYHDYNYVGEVDHRGGNLQNERHNIVYTPTDVLSSVRWDTDGGWC